MKHAVKELQREDIIEEVPKTQPMPCVSTIVAVPKKDDTVSGESSYQSCEIPNTYGQSQKFRFEWCRALFETELS